MDTVLNAALGHHRPQERRPLDHRLAAQVEFDLPIDGDDLPSLDFDVQRPGL